jgi:pyruvate,water dikinase
VDYVIGLTDAARATPERVGPKAATLAWLKEVGLPVPDGFCLTAAAYRAQLRAAGLEASIRGADDLDPRRRALRVKLGFQRTPLETGVAGALAAAWRELMRPPGALAAVRSSALAENTPTASFAGQFDSFLGIATEADLVTAVRACWACLWASRALRYMEAHHVDPAGTAMAVLVQRLVEARAAGGALSRTADGHLLLTGSWGLGTVVAQGEVVPDRFVVRRDGTLAEAEPGRKDRRALASAEAGLHPQPVTRELMGAPCLNERQARELASMVLTAEATLGTPVEIEWALDAEGFQILQARPLQIGPRRAPDELWSRHPGLTGQPAGVGWGSGSACLVLDEHDLHRVSLGDVLVTRVAGPALIAVLPLVAGVVAELGGSSAHLATLARERGIPAVLGVPGATRRIPEGALVAVDGVAGLVRWIS